MTDDGAEDLFEHAPCGFVATTPEGTIVRVNQTLLRWTGHDRDALIGKRFVDLLSAGGRLFHETHYAPLLHMQGEVREIAFDLLRANGGRLPALVNSVLRRDADGNPQAIHTTVFDATDRRAYERELLRARDRERQARERAEVLQQTMEALAAESTRLYEHERRRLR